MMRRHLFNELATFVSQYLTVNTPFVSIYAKVHPPL